MTNNQATEQQKGELKPLSEICNEARKHYAETGCYKPEHIHRILGNPADSFSSIKSEDERALAACKARANSQSELEKLNQELVNALEIAIGDILYLANEAKELPRFQSTIDITTAALQRHANLKKEG